MLVSINIKNMPSVKEIMTQVKSLVKQAPKNAIEVTTDDLSRVLYISGAMLYAVCQSPASGVNDLLRETLAILRFADRLLASFQTDAF